MGCKEAVERLVTAGEDGKEWAGGCCVWLSEALFLLLCLLLFLCASGVAGVEGCGTVRSLDGLGLDDRSYCVILRLVSSFFNLLCFLGAI